MTVHTEAVNKTMLANYFHLPISQVARILGMCTTMLKKLCRRHGIPRWPYRRIKSIDKMIADIEKRLTEDQQQQTTTTTTSTTTTTNEPQTMSVQEASDMRHELTLLRAKRQQIFLNPEILSQPPRFTSTTTSSSSSSSALLLRGTSTSTTRSAGGGVMSDGEDDEDETNPDDSPALPMQLPFNTQPTQQPQPPPPPMMMMAPTMMMIGQSPLRFTQTSMHPPSLPSLQQPQPQQPFLRGFMGSFTAPNPLLGSPPITHSSPFFALTPTTLLPSSSSAVANGGLCITPSPGTMTVNTPPSLSSSCSSFMSLSTLQPHQITQQMSQQPPPRLTLIPQQQQQQQQQEETTMNRPLLRAQDIVSINPAPPQQSLTRSASTSSMVQATPPAQQTLYFSPPSYLLQQPLSSSTTTIKQSSTTTPAATTTTTTTTQTNSNQRMSVNFLIQ